VRSTRLVRGKLYHKVLVATLLCSIPTLPGSGATELDARVKVPRAVAITTTIDFETIPPGTSVTDQYHALGVDFLDFATSDPEGGLVPTIAFVGAGTAHSGTQVLDLNQPLNEFYRSWAGGKFVTTVSRVSMRVGYFSGRGTPGMPPSSVCRPTTPLTRSWHRRR